MPEPTLDNLETVFAQVVDILEKDEFDSHEFILRLAHEHQCLYVVALAVYADTDQPFQIVHSEIAKRLLKYPNLVNKTGETVSKDIFGQKNPCARWRRIR